MRPEVLDQLRAIDGARRRRAERIEVQLESAQPEHAPQAGRHQDEFDVDVRARETEGFDVDLVELAIAAFLRPLVAEHRAHQPDLLALVVQQAVRDAGADDARRRFGPQRQRIVATVPERVHLLLDDVGELADRALEELGALEQRQPDLAIAVLREDFAGRAFEQLPRRRLVGQHVVHAADGLQGFAHRPVTVFNAATRPDRC